VVPVLVVGADASIGLVDGALMRPGRCSTASCAPEAAWVTRWTAARWATECCATEDSIRRDASPDAMIATARDVRHGQSSVTIDAFRLVFLYSF